MSLKPIHHWKRFVQGLFSSGLFSFPWTYRIRNAVYQVMFGLPKTTIVLENAKILTLHNINGGGVSFGEKVVLNSHVMLDVTGNLRIGKNVVFSEGATIFTHMHEIDIANKRAGAHVTIVGRCQKQYIVPMCHRHNTQFGEEMLEL